MKAANGGGGTVSVTAGFLGFSAVASAAGLLGGVFALGFPLGFALGAAEAGLCLPPLATEAEISCARLASRSRSNDISIAFSKFAGPAGSGVSDNGHQSANQLTACFLFAISLLIA